MEISNFNNINANEEKKIDELEGFITSFNYPDDFKFDIDEQNKYADNAKIKNLNPSSLLNILYPQIIILFSNNKLIWKSFGMEGMIQ